MELFSLMPVFTAMKASDFCEECREDCTPWQIWLSPHLWSWKEFYLFSQLTTQYLTPEWIAVISWWHSNLDSCFMDTLPWYNYPRWLDIWSDKNLRMCLCILPSVGSWDTVEATQVPLKWGLWTHLFCEISAPARCDCWESYTVSCSLLQYFWNLSVSLSKCAGKSTPGLMFGFP